MLFGGGDKARLNRARPTDERSRSDLFRQSTPPPPSSNVKPRCGFRPERKGAESGTGPPILYRGSRTFWSGGFGRPWTLFPSRRKREGVRRSKGGGRSRTPTGRH